MPTVTVSPFSLFLCLVVVVSVFWDFGSLFRTLRRHSGLLLRQQQCFDVAASLMSAVAAARISVFLILRCLRSLPWSVLDRRQRRDGERC